MKTLLRMGINAVGRHPSRAFASALAGKLIDKKKIFPWIRHNQVAQKKTGSEYCIHYPAIADINSNAQAYSPVIQRKCAACEEEKNMFTRRKILAAKRTEAMS